MGGFISFNYLRVISGRGIGFEQSGYTEINRTGVICMKRWVWVGEEGECRFKKELSPHEPTEFSTLSSEHRTIYIPAFFYIQKVCLLLYKLFAALMKGQSSPGA